MAFTDRQRRDILMLRGLNRTYGEIAEYLNSEYGIATSESAVGRAVREMEAESRNGDPWSVFTAVVGHGYASDLLGE